jgi:hypothetical protein
MGQVESNHAESDFQDFLRGRRTDGKCGESLGIYRQGASVFLFLLMCLKLRDASCRVVQLWFLVFSSRTCRSTSGLQLKSSLQSQSQQHESCPNVRTRHAACSPHRVQDTYPTLRLLRYGQCTTRRWASRGAPHKAHAKNLGGFGAPSGSTSVPRSSTRNTNRPSSILLSRLPSILPPGTGPVAQGWRASQSARVSKPGRSQSQPPDAVIRASELGWGISTSTSRSTRTIAVCKTEASQAGCECAWRALGIPHACPPVFGAV